MNWVVWLVVTVGWFLAMELPALRSREPGDTLSEHFWSWLRVRDRRSTPLTVAGRVGLAAFLVWLAGHLSMGWWTM